MHRDAHCELRVLSGTHAGARALVMQDTQIVGSDPECDFVLSDEGVLARHARLERREDGSSVLSWLDGSLAPLVVRPGQGTRIGPVSIAIEPADAPWKDEVELVEAQAVPEAATAADAGDGAGEAGTESEAAGGTLATGVAAGESGDEGRLTGDPDAEPLAAQAARRQGRLQAGLRARVRNGLATLAAVSAVTLTGWALWHGQSVPATGAGTVLAGGDTALGGRGPSADITQLNALRSVVSDLQLEDRVHIENPAGGAPRVVAAWLSDDEAEALAAALNRLAVRPRLRLESEPDIVAKVQDHVLRQPGAGSEGLKASYLGQGRFRIEGRVASEGARETLLAALAREFPLVRGFDSALVTQAEAGEAMLSELKAQGVGEIEGRWQEGALRLKVRLAAQAVPQWELVLQTVVARHGLPFRAEVETLAAGVPGAMVRGAGLPFAVRSIVSGDPSYVTLADGRRLVAEGRADGWRLVEIGSKQVIFEGAGGRRVSVER